MMVYSNIFSDWVICTSFFPILLPFVQDAANGRSGLRTGVQGSRERRSFLGKRLKRRELLVLVVALGSFDGEVNKEMIAE
jgi:hypothetical protein